MKCSGGICGGDISVGDGDWSMDAFPSDIACFVDRDVVEQYMCVLRLSFPTDPYFHADTREEVGCIQVACRACAQGWLRSTCLADATCPACRMALPPRTLQKLEGLLKRIYDSLKYRCPCCHNMSVVGELAGHICIFDLEAPSPEEASGRARTGEDVSYLAARIQEVRTTDRGTEAGPRICYLLSNSREAADFRISRTEQQCYFRIFDTINRREADLSLHRNATYDEFQRLASVAFLAFLEINRSTSA